MKRISLQTSLVILRLSIIATVLAVPALFLLSFKAAQHVAGDLWKQIGITEKQASEKIINAFMYGYMDYSGSKNVKNMAAGNRAAVIKDFVLYSKSFLNGPVFKSAYAKERALSKPAAIQLMAVSKEDVRKERIDALKKNIKESEALIKKMPALEKDARKAIAGYENAIKDYESPDSKMLNIFYETAVNQQKNTRQQYEKRMQEWEAAYPEDYKKKVKKYLEHYLAQGATVDFDAVLIEKYNKKIFEKRDYEAKNSEWKMIYRAGREVYNAVKPVAEQWVKEIQ